MGADLYIESITETSPDRYDNPGYFWDGYNSLGLFRHLRLDWYQDVATRLQDSRLPIEECKRLRNFLEGTKIFSRQLPDDIQAKRDQLSSFLKLAIDLNEPPYCSL